MTTRCNNSWSTFLTLATLGMLLGAAAQAAEPDDPPAETAAEQIGLATRDGEDLGF